MLLIKHIGAIIHVQPGIDVSGHCPERLGSDPHTSLNQILLCSFPPEGRSNSVNNVHHVGRMGVELCEGMYGYLRGWVSVKTLIYIAFK